VEIVGTQLQKHRARLGDGTVGTCPMSGKPVDLLSHSFRAKAKKKRAN
jgi:hypothetical protein